VRIVRRSSGSLAWAYRKASDLGIDPGRIGIIGGSAGGGLAAGLALLARDRAEIPVAFQALSYPMLDDRQITLVRPGRRPAVGAIGQPVRLALLPQRIQS